MAVLGKEAIKSIFPAIFMLTSKMGNAAPVEAWYQKVWCEGMGGEVEYRLKNGQRIDCLTHSYAIEIEFAPKWPEAIGQSLNYSFLTGKKPGIVLVLKTHQDHTHWQRLQSLIKHYDLPIKLWKLGP